MKKFQLGFTLIELLVVITIIAILAGVGMVSFSSAGRSARDARRQADIQTIRQALVMYRSETGCYPTGNISGAIGTLIAAGYLSNPEPKDPKSPAMNYSYTPKAGSITCNTSPASNGAPGFTLFATLENGGNYQVGEP